MENRICKNRKSPRNEQDFIDAYKRLNPSIRKNDGLDIAAVVTKDNKIGHAQIPQDINRSHDDKYHVGKGFVEDAILKKHFNK